METRPELRIHLYIQDKLKSLRETLAEYSDDDERRPLVEGMISALQDAEYFSLSVCQTASLKRPMEWIAFNGENYPPNTSRVILELYDVYERERSYELCRYKPHGGNDHRWIAADGRDVFMSAIRRPIAYAIVSASKFQSPFEKGEPIE